MSAHVNHRGLRHFDAVARFTKILQYGGGIASAISPFAENKAMAGAALTTIHVKVDINHQSQSSEQNDIKHRAAENRWPPFGRRRASTLRHTRSTAAIIASFDTLAGRYAPR